MSTPDSKKCDVSLIALLYLLSSGLILALWNTVYWDDWIVCHAAPKVVIDLFTQQAATLFYLEGYMHVLLMQAGPWLYKLTTLLMMGATGYFLYRIIERRPEIDRDTRFFIVLFFLIAPLYIARVALIDYRYTLSYFLFWCAWYCLEKHKKTALILFFLSFNTQSFLVFYALPILDQFQRENKGITPKICALFIRKNWTFIAAPFFYFAIKLACFPPSGRYLGYNEQFSLTNVLPAAAHQFASIYRLPINSYLLLLIACFSGFSYFVLRNHIERFTSKKNPVLARKLLGYGVIAVFFGSFPYWILGYIPTFHEWTTRYQILLPLGYALIAIAVIAAIPKPIARLLLAFLAGASIAINVFNYINFYIDGRKQDVLISAIAQNSDIKDANLVVFRDLTQNINAIKRTYRPYEWNGMLKVAFGNEQHYSVDFSDWPDTANQKVDPVKNSFFMASDFRQPYLNNPLFVTIAYGNSNSWQWLMDLFVHPSQAFVITTSKLSTSG